MACEWVRLEIIEYMIFECNIEKTKDITNYFKNHKNREKILYVEKMFELRDLKKDLSLQLESKNSKIKQNKI